jgi:hypothetical protein
MFALDRLKVKVQDVTDVTGLLWRESRLAPRRRPARDRRRRRAGAQNAIQTRLARGSSIPTARALTQRRRRRT